MTRVVIGSFEAGADTVVIPEAALKRAAAALDAAAEQRERQAEAVNADALRRTNTKRARVMRRFKKAVTLLRGGIR
jgi:hypothetical protein